MKWIPVFLIRKVSWLTITRTDNTGEGGAMCKVVTGAFVAALMIGITSTTAAQSVQCSSRPDQAFGGVATSRVGTGVLFKTRGLAVDADGAPNSYRVDGKGLSNTCDGVAGMLTGSA